MRLYVKGSSTRVSLSDLLSALLALARFKDLDHQMYALFLGVSLFQLQKAVVDSVNDSLIQGI